MFPSRFIGVHRRLSAAKKIFVCGVHRRSSAVNRIFAFLAALAALAGCSTAPLERSGLPPTPQAFKESAARATAPAATQPRGEWWKAFADPVLDDLVARANAKNTSIDVAAARLTQARALVRAANAGLLPQLGTRASFNRQGGPLINAAGGEGNLFTVAGDLSYEVDLFGRLNQTSRAANLDARSREALLQSTRLVVQADISQTYLALRAVDAERALMRGTLAAYRDTLDLTQRRFQSGSVAELDVVRVRAEVATTESDALVLDRRRAELEHALALLVGEPASTFSIAENPQWMTALPIIPAGVPSTVLARRPDVSAAQRTMQAAQARVGLANAAWFPTLSLTASGGYASPQLGDLFRMSMRAWGIGALLALPIFDGGRREAGLQNASAELDAAFATYREQILVAFKDVEDQLSALRILSEHSDVQTRAVESASRATVLSESRYRSGLGSQLDVLDAKRTELRSQRQALQVRAAQYQATVGLVRALGGGWDTPPNAQASVESAPKL